MKCHVGMIVDICAFSVAGPETIAISNMKQVLDASFILSSDNTTFTWADLCFLPGMCAGFFE